MTEPLQPREVRDVEELRALAHPMRQRILRRLRQTGSATSTTLARDLGENSGIMSYHLRLLAEHDFVHEVTGRGQGRERWWEVSPQQRFARFADFLGELEEAHLHGCIAAEGVFAMVP